MVNSGLNLTKLCGRGYDGRATMAGKVNGIAKLISERYKKALFFHSKRLNLVFNDLNKIMVIRKEIIKFYRESTFRKSTYTHYLPAISFTAAKRSFSSLRRVKTRLNSATGEDRLNGLCMLSVYRERVSSSNEK